MKFNSVFLYYIGATRRADDKGLNVNKKGYTRNMNVPTQTTGYSFGIGQSGAVVRTNYPLAGAGGGYYGGYSYDNGSTNERL